MRSLLFVPGGSAKMLAKAASSDADAVILDLEDAVRPDLKNEARAMTAGALRGAFRSRRYVRINPLSSQWCEADVAAIAAMRPHGLMLPKVTGPQDIEALDRLISRFEPAAAKGATRVIAICTETPAATLALAAASWKSPRLEGLLWGGEDLSAELGALANRDAKGGYTATFLLARSLCLLAARAAGVLAIDAVYTDFRDTNGLLQEAEAARRDGFDAKAAIHPDQIAIINAAFAPSDAERTWAEQVVKAFGEAKSGVAVLNGSMLDAPHLKRAERILAAVRDRLAGRERH